MYVGIRSKKAMLNNAQSLFELNKKTMCGDHMRDHMRVRSGTYVCAWTAMLRSRGMGSKELEKRSCIYSWKSTPLAEPVLS